MTLPDTFSTLFAVSFVDALAGIVAFLLSAWGGILITWGGLRAARRIFWIEAEPWKQPQTPALELVRHHFGQRIVLGLEFFLAGDILRLLIDPGPRELTRVGVLVIIRVLLSYVVTRELTMSTLLPPPSRARRKRPLANV